MVYYSWNPLGKMQRKIKDAKCNVNPMQKTIQYLPDKFQSRLNRIYCLELYI